MICSICVHTIQEYKEEYTITHMYGPCTCMVPVHYIVISIFGIFGKPNISLTQEGERRFVAQKDPCVKCAKNAQNEKQNV